MKGVEEGYSNHISEDNAAIVLRKIEKYRRKRGCAAPPTSQGQGTDGKSPPQIPPASSVLSLFHYWTYKTDFQYHGVIIQVRFEN